VLSGLIGALLAAGLEPWWAAGCAAYVHSLAAELAASGDAAGGAGAPVGASGLLASVSEAIRVVRRGETMASW
jgi:NAD(P)H-hydrate repair Nnr-like enzyme with NAD(P)H-hydrate dehydratase domain